MSELPETLSLTVSIPPSNVSAGTTISAISAIGLGVPGRDGAGASYPLPVNVADYRLDEDEDDTASFGRAFAAADVVVIPSTRTFVATSIEIPSNKTLRAASGKATILKAGTAGNLIQLTGSNNVTIEGITLDGNSRAGGMGIYVLFECDSVAIKSCSIKDFALAGICYSGGSTRAYVCDNTVSGTGASGISIGASDSIIAQNIVEDSGAANITFLGARNLVANNICRSPGQDAEAPADNITGYSRDNLDCVIIGNLCEGSGNNGIHVGGNRGVLSGNYVRNSQNKGIFVASDPNEDPTQGGTWVVTGNCISDVNLAAAGAGAAIGARNINNISVTANSITGSSTDGIQLYDCDNYAIASNVVLGCSLAGIAVYNSNYGSINGNKISDCVNQGVLLTGSDASKASSDNLVVGNHVRGCGESIRSRYLSTRNFVHHNMVAGNTLSAVQLVGGDSGADNFSGTQTGVMEAVGTRVALSYEGARKFSGGDAGISFFGYPEVTKTGWSTATGTATRTTFDTATVTLPQLAERVKALIDDLHQTSGYGLLRS